MSKLLRRAKVNYEYAVDSKKRIKTDDIYADYCCYHLQQSIEFTVKYIVEMQGDKYFETHDIRKNLALINDDDLKSLISDIRKMASTLNEWEANSRYNDEFFAMNEDIDDAIKIAEKLINYADTLQIEKEDEYEDMEL